MGHNSKNEDDADRGGLFYPGGKVMRVGKVFSKARKRTG